MERNLHEFVCLKNFFWVCLFPTISKSHKWLSKNENLAKNRQFCQNHHKTTNIGLYDNCIHWSLVLIIKYIVCEFHGCKTVFKEIRIFWILKKNKMFFWYFCCFLKKVKCLLFVCFLFYCRLWSLFGDKTSKSAKMLFKKKMKNISISRNIPPT